MTTIPVSPNIIQVNPSVLSAGGAGIALTGMVCSSSTRVPVGTVQNFASQPAVAAYFGVNSPQAAFATVYFNGFDNKTQAPASLLYTQFNMNAVAAYERGASQTGTLAALQQLSGTFSAIVDGYTWNAGSVNLSTATSFSNAASLIQTALVGSPPAVASVTGSIAAGTASVTASIAGNVMYVTALASGTVHRGMAITGTGVSANTVVDGQLSGTAGGIGTYAVNNSQIVASTTISGTYGILTVTAVSSGALAVGQTVTGSGVTAGTIITELGSGTGGNGTYYVNLTQTATSTTITGSGTAPTVTFDATASAFVVTSGIRGAASTMAFSTGTLATALGMTSTTGAVLSQGAAPQTPSGFMATLTALTQAFATFSTDFDPDGGPGTITQKLAFSQWTSQQNKRYAYVGWDTDPNPTTTLPATGSFGYALQTNLYDGTIPVWEPSDLYHEAFVMGMAASINWNAKGGRITLAFKSQSGLTAGVSTQQAATNLAGNPQAAGSFGNGYNFYGAYATALTPYNWFQRGTISGSYTWADTYLNQIWLNQQIIAAEATLLSQVNSVPFNSTGYTLIQESLSGVIAAALNNGVIVAGVTLSATQAAQVNLAAGLSIASTLQQQGWYLQVLPATPAQRQARGTPPINFWYCDGGSIQCISLGSVVLQ